MSSVAVACCQLTLKVGEREHNLASCERALAEAAAAGAEVIVLPELANSGYVFADALEARALAETLDGPFVSMLARRSTADGTVVAAGFCELDRDVDAVRNSAVLVERGEVRALYRKAHLWDRENEVFTPGDEPPPVLLTKHGRLALMVCYDLEFPEWVRLAALAGAQLLCVPTNWPAETRPDGERPIEVVRLQAAASVNRIFIAACDRAGVERGVAWTSGSVVAGPDGYPLAGPVCADADATIIAACELAHASDKRISAHNDVLLDRRPALYGELL